MNDLNEEVPVNQPKPNQDSHSLDDLFESIDVQEDADKLMEFLLGKRDKI